MFVLKKLYIINLSITEGNVNMEIKEIRTMSGLSQRQFAEKYHIPFGTYQKWEVPVENMNHRDCPLYVKELLERVVREDFEIK